MSPKELNKEEFIKLMCQKVEEKDDYLTQKEATDMLNLVLECLTDTVATGKGTNFIGFGKFSIKERAARKGRNPQTGEEIQIDASKVPAFKPGKALKDAIK